MYHSQHIAFKRNRKGHMQNKSELIYAGFLLDYHCPTHNFLWIYLLICFLLVQLMTNDKFISVYHQVLSKRVGPRISVASFFMNFTISECTSKVYGPIKEFLSEKECNMPICLCTLLLTSFKWFTANWFL